MRTDTPALLATLLHRATNEVRHLLLLFVDGSKITNLVQISSGLKTLIESGTEYEMRQRATLLQQEWAEDGFEVRPERHQVYERLQWTIVLALNLGHKVVYDDRFKQMQKLPLNIGVVPLTDWPGMTGNNGEPYEYSLDGMTLRARPVTPATPPTLVAPKDGKQFATFALAQMARQNAIEPTADFLLDSSI